MKVLETMMIHKKNNSPLQTSKLHHWHIDNNLIYTQIHLSLQRPNKQEIKDYKKKNQKRAKDKTSEDDDDEMKLFFKLWP